MLSITQSHVGKKNEYKKISGSKICCILILTHIFIIAFPLHFVLAVVTL